MEITKKDIGIGIGSLFVVYALGFFGQSLREGENNKNIVEYLSDRKAAITRNIERYNQNIPLMKESFISQYSDSLENAVKDTTFLEKEIKIAEEEGSKFRKRLFSSWFGYFMD